MASSRISFRSRKVTRELHQCLASSVENGEGAAAIPGDGRAPSTKRKFLPEEEAGKTLALTETLISGISSSKRKTRKPRQRFTTVEQVTVSVTSLSAVEAVAAAIQHLKASDAKLREVIEVSQLPCFQSCTSPFRSLARSIVYQQLATNAAAAIYNRLLDLCGGEVSLTPATISKLSASELRTIGISARKASYLHDLSRNFLEGDLSDVSIMGMEDGKLMSALTAVKGIGVWSVHMFMIFALHRPDVLPVSDLGVRKGFSKLYGLKALPTPEEMEQLSAAWRPYRSLGAWYMWRLVEGKASAEKKAGMRSFQ